MKLLDKTHHGHMPGQRNNRCNAKVRHRRSEMYYRAGYCRNRPVPGKMRCRLHGGRSTGPMTDDGMERTTKAMVAGRRRWLDRLKAEGKKAPCGRKAGPKWMTKNMLAKLDIEAGKISGVAAPPPAPPPKRKRGRPSNAENMALFLALHPAR